MSGVYASSEPMVLLNSTKTLFVDLKVQCFALSPLSFSYAGSPLASSLFAKAYTLAVVSFCHLIFDDRFTVFDSRNGAVGGAKVYAVINSVSHVQWLLWPLALRHCDFSDLMTSPLKRTSASYPGDDSFTLRKALINGEFSLYNHAVFVWFAKHSMTS